MMPISSLSMLAFGILDSWQMAQFWLCVYILIVGLRDRRHINSGLRNGIMLLLCAVHYTVFQCSVAFTAQNSHSAIVLSVVERYVALPVLLVVGVCLVLTVVEVYLFFSMRRWYNTHITSASIKETIETLPVGICAFEPSGKITLKNKTMEQLCRSLTGLPLLSGNELVHTLSEKKSDLTDFAVSLPDAGVWSFTKDEIHHKSGDFTLLIAYNVTEAYQKTQMLAQRQKTVEELNEKLLAYNKQIEQVITQQEILNAKVRIHDELGASLLGIRRYLVSGGTEAERADMLERLRENVRFLQQEAAPRVEDEYSLILSTAEDLGVIVRINGMMPQSQPNKHILATAIHECFTNILRHTNGDTLFVEIREGDNTFTARFTDNNTRPVSAVAETGGLRSLRDLTEGAGGPWKLPRNPNTP